MPDFFDWLAETLGKGFSKIFLSEDARLEKRVKESQDRLNKIKKSLKIVETEKEIQTKLNLIKGLK